jgi:hypothetical protein
MCRTWSKQLENEGVTAMCRGYPLFFISEHFHLCFDEDKGQMDNALLNFYHKYFGE